MAISKQTKPIVRLNQYFMSLGYFSIQLQGKTIFKQ